ncbi:hypothetical protein SUGI_0957320 [Cryptomeria japonica]|nr:hypothetical protein SUGI_0957320 [Cryptomeria japonica]
MKSPGISTFALPQRYQDQILPYGMHKLLPKLEVKEASNYAVVSVNFNAIAAGAFALHEIMNCKSNFYEAARQKFHGEGHSVGSSA